MKKADRRLQRRSNGFTALCTVAALSAASVGCEAPWYVRPKQPSRVSVLHGRNDDFRVCVRQSDRPIHHLQLDAEGKPLEGTFGPPDSSEACASFEGPAAARALDGESTLIAEAKGSNAPERIPLTSKNIEFRPYSSFEASARLGYVLPLAEDYAGLVELHNTLFYRLSPLRVGAVFEGRVNFNTALLGTGLVVNGSLPLSGRWVLGLDASYGLGIAAYGAGKWDGQWYHGPSATLSLGRTPAAFLGAPGAVDRAALGPVISVEYLRVPRQDQAFIVLGAGLMIRYGL